MLLEFNVNKIVEYLKQYKDQLPSLYQWEAKNKPLVDLKVISSEELDQANGMSPYEKEIFLKPKIKAALHASLIQNPTLFDKICLWIIREWGGIKGGKTSNTLQLLEVYKNNSIPSFHRIASSSKVGSFMFPEKYIIYDSRVAYSLNWILLSQNASNNKFFPIPEGRNSKMLAFDMNVLIRLKNVQKYQANQLTDLNNRQYINNKDKDCYIPKELAYQELNKLITQIHQQLWGSQKPPMLYYTEMLLFAIADKEIYNDITKRVSINIDKF